MDVLFLIFLIVIGVSLFVLVLLRLTSNRRTVNEQMSKPIILKVAVPRHNEKSPVAAEQLFSSLHGMVAGKPKSIDHFSLEIAAGSYGIHFILVVDQKYRSFIENQFYAQYPDANITQIGDYTQSFTKDYSYGYKELGLRTAYYLPIKTFTSFEVDPLAAITSAISALDGSNSEAFIQIVARPLNDSWQSAGKNYVNGMRNSKDTAGNRISLESGEAERLAQIERKNTKVGFQFAIRIVTKARDKISADRLNNEIQASFGQYQTGSFNSIGNPPSVKGFAKLMKDINKSINGFIFGQSLNDQLSGLEKYRSRFLNELETDIINVEELASLYHLPNKSVETPNISWVESKKLEYPLDIPTHSARMIGVTDYRGINIPFGIKPVDRLRHMYLLGKTGMGKSTFIESLIAADMYDGQGLAFIDPHGDAINNILDMLPPHRLDDVIVFDPGDSEYPIGFNLLEIKPGENPSLVADGLVSVFKKAFSDSWGPRLEYVLTNTILTLLQCQNVSLLAIPRILTDKNYRKFLLKQVNDPVLLKFWHEEYANMTKTPKDTMDNIGSILNKIGRFTTNPLIRNIIGQVKSSFDIAEAMNNKKIVLINLSQGKIGEENMGLLGGMLITKMYSSIVKRVDIDRAERIPFYLYVDEFQNFATSTFVKILSEARKFGLGLAVTHQFIDQIDEDIRNAIFGNIGTIMNFSVGPRDAEVLAKEYSPYLTSEDLINLEKYSFVIKLSIEFAQSKPFTGKTVKAEYAPSNLRQAAIEKSREQFGKPRDVMEQKIYKWAAQTYDEKGNLIQNTQQPAAVKTTTDSSANKSTTKETNSAEPLTPAAKETE